MSRSGPRKRLSWFASDPFLRGPYAAPAGAKEHPFLVPAHASPGFRFSRLVSGQAWPAGLATLERLAPVPSFDDTLAERTAERDVVVFVEEPPGERRPLIWRTDEGAVAWCCDPLHWIRGILIEEYVPSWTRPLPSRIPLFNYSRLPHVLKGLLQAIQSPRARVDPQITPFPRLPLDDFADTLRRLAAVLAAGSPPRMLTLWPNACEAAVTVTHDVDTHWILDDSRRGLLREIVETEVSLGFRGAWYITADQLDRGRHAGAIEILKAAGCEFGAHGWNHDAKLNYLNRSQQSGRMNRVAARFAGLGIEGMRTPWYCRSAELSEVMARHFTYDTSIPNASAFHSSGSHSGCCTFFPFQACPGLFELPLTLPPDTALDPASGYATLMESVDEIVAKGGVVVITHHPQPHQSANPAALGRYLAFLSDFRARHGERTWSATPGEIVRRYQTACVC